MGGEDWVVDIGPCKCGSYRIGRQDENRPVEPPALHRCEKCHFEGSYAVHVDCPQCRMVTEASMRVEFARGIDTTFIVTDETWSVDPVSGEPIREIVRLDLSSLDFKMVVDTTDFDAKMEQVLGVLPDQTIEIRGRWVGGNTNLRLDGDRVVWDATGKEWTP